MIALPIHDADASEGERLKLKAHSLLKARREAIVRRARRALLSVLIQNGEATADDVRAVVSVPEGVNPKLFGAVPGELAELGIIFGDRYVKSARPEAHARPVQLWLLIDRAAAVQWLTTHPELPDAIHNESDLGDLFNNSNKKPAVGAAGV